MRSFCNSEVIDGLFWLKVVTKVRIFSVACIGWGVLIVHFGLMPLLCLKMKSALERIKVINSGGKSLIDALHASKWWWETRYCKSSNYPFKVKHDMNGSSKFVIYVLTCVRCQENYIGETKIKLHRQHIRDSKYRILPASGHFVQCTQNKKR